MTITQEALKKLDEGAKVKTTDRYGNVIKTYVHNALAGFCRQNEAFAQAVVNGGTLPDCIKHCTEGLHENTGISDIDIYRRAVQFYFPGAAVDFHIHIMTDGMETTITEEPDRTSKQKESTTKAPDAITEQRDVITEESAAEVKQKKQPAARKRKKETSSNVIQLDLF